MSERLSEALKRKGLTSLWYLAHIENVGSILERGILSYNRIREMELPHRSIANRDVQARRTSLANGVDLHDCVPLYMAWENPMLYAVKDYPLAYFQVSLEATDTEGTLFSDGNVAANATWFFEKANQVDRIPWNVILGSRWYGSEIVDGKRKRCAEVLVPDSVEAKYFLNIYCNRPIKDVQVPSQFLPLLRQDLAFPKVGKPISIDDFLSALEDSSTGSVI